MTPLEDHFGDVISKAMGGRHQTDVSLAAAIGRSSGEVLELRNGHWQPEIGRSVALALGLNPEALESLANGKAQPPPLSVHGLESFSTSFGEMMVNSYLVWDAHAKRAIAFDTGADVSGLLDFLNQRGLSLEALLITHTHGDHIFDMDRLREKTGAPAFVNALEPLEGAESFQTGTCWNVGALTVESRLTFGHTTGGTTYVIRGLPQVVAVVGDALFAASMGSPKVSYEGALRTNREEIFSLPDDCVLCPGHGPLTTVGWEKTHNPFFGAV